MISLGLILLLQQPPASAPRRTVPDPGVIATDQRITPAGMQTVFDDRVSGVRFGRSSNDIWVAVGGGVRRLQWRTDTLLMRAPINGRPGVHGIAMDPVTGRALVSYVSRVPGARAPGQARP